MEPPKITPEGSKDISHQAADILEVVEKAQDPATSSGATVQDISEITQPQPAGHPPLGQ